MLHATVPHAPGGHWFNGGTVSMLTSSDVACITNAWTCDSDTQQDKTMHHGSEWIVSNTVCVFLWRKTENQTHTHTGRYLTCRRCWFQPSMRTSVACDAMSSLLGFIHYAHYAESKSVNFNKLLNRAILIDGETQKFEDRNGHSKQYIIQVIFLFMLPNLSLQYLSTERDY